MKIIGLILSLIVASTVSIVIWALITALPIMWLWNYLIPTITNNALGPIDFFQALALFVLCSILFVSPGKTSSGS